MQAILVKYRPATDHRAACYAVSADAGKMKIMANHAQATTNARRFCAETFVLEFMPYAPNVPLLEGTLPNGDSVFVFDHEASRSLISTTV